MVDFIVKRAFRAGSAVRTDVVRAFDVSPATASRALRNALERRPDLLEKQSVRIVPKLLAAPPPFASEEALLRTLDEGDHDFLARTGFYQHELPVSYVSWRHSTPNKPGIISLVVQSIRNSGFVRIAYLGMRLGEQPASRIVAPLSLEQIDGQWRIIAQDMGKTGYPIRVFVLTRILEADEHVFKRRPKGFVRQHHIDAISSVSVSFNPRLSKHQQQVVAAELGIVDGKVTMAQRGLFEFLRRYSDESVSENAVWPPLYVQRNS